MSTVTEPPVKKMKKEGLPFNKDLIEKTIDDCIDNIRKNTKNLQAVISDDLIQPIPTTKVYAGHIKNIQDISKTLRILNEKIPLEKLSHLKRVSGKKILICTKNLLNSVISLQEYLDSNVKEVSNAFNLFEEVEVPISAPRLKKQMKDANILWSCNFHPNAYLESLLSGRFFTDTELNNHKKYMEIVLEIRRWQLHYMNIDELNNLNAAVVVNSNIDKVVTVAFDNRKHHPMQHSAMLAIDNVSKTQHGGAWTDTDIKTGELKDYLRNKFPESFVLFKVEDLLQVNIEKPYLCTGYYIYLLREPCFMCSMALVHARVRRVFFCFENSSQGALKTKAKLQTVKSLNHHFEVFTGFL